MLKVCLNGVRGAHERVPVTPAELAVSAAAAVAAGAEAIHVHPRGDRGRQSLDGELIALTLHVIRQAVPGVPVGVSTLASVVPDPAERLSLVRGWPTPHDEGPDFASVNWHEDGAVDIANLLRVKGIGVEAGLFTPRAAASFVGSRWPWQVMRVLVECVPGVTPGGYGVWAADRVLAALGPQPSRVLVHGEDAWAWPVLRWGQSHGYDTRIGLEDTLYDEKGRRVSTNAELVAAALMPPAHP